MADLFKNEAKKALTFTGTFGNASLAHFTRTLAAAQIGDKVYLGVIPKGSRVYQFFYSHDAMGVGTTLSWGREPVDGSEASDDVHFRTASDSSSAVGKFSLAAASALLDKDYYVYAIVGGAAATGQITASLLYLYEGVK